MVRKADSVEHNEWVEMSTSARKKLVKGIELWRKKETKREADGEKLDIEKREAEERERKKREEAKGVILTDDSSKGHASKVRHHLKIHMAILSIKSSV